MAKKNSRNNDFLSEYRERTTPKIYSLLVDLINDERQNLAELVVKVDYLIDYANTCIKQKDFQEGREALEGAKNRIEKLNKEQADTSHLVYLYEGAIKKCK